MQTHLLRTERILSAAERVTLAIARVSEGLINGEWTIREGCRQMKVHPQTYYKHRKSQGGGEPIAAAGAPCITHPDQEATQTGQDSTNGEAG